MKKTCANIQVFHYGITGDGEAEGGDYTQNRYLHSSVEVIKCLWDE